MINKILTGISIFYTVLLIAEGSLISLAFTTFVFGTDLILSQYIPVIIIVLSLPVLGIIIILNHFGKQFITTETIKYIEIWCLITTTLLPISTMVATYGEQSLRSELEFTEEMIDTTDKKDKKRNYYIINSWEIRSSLDRIYFTNLILMNVITGSGVVLISQKVIFYFKNRETVQDEIFQSNTKRDLKSLRKISRRKFH